VNCPHERVAPGVRSRIRLKANTYFFVERFQERDCPLPVTAFEALPELLKRFLPLSAREERHELDRLGYLLYDARGEDRRAGGLSHIYLEERRGRLPYRDGETGSDCAVGLGRNAQAASID